MADAMLTNHRAKLKQIVSFPSLVGYLRDEMGWPIAGDDLEEIYFEYTAEELGIEPANAAKILEIKRLRPLSVGQPWGIFFVRFEPKRLPVVALRRILSRVVLKKRASANSAERAAWDAEDLLFVSNFGEDDERQICFAHFTVDEQKTDLPTLKVLGWNDLDTPLRLDDVAETLTERLAWPDDEKDVERWRERWRSAFPLRHREVITTSKLLAERLAELARAIRNRINTVLSVETEVGPVTKLMKAFREALVHDLDADGFADMYAQTIAYGLLSARIADPRANTADDLSAHMRTNPFLKELMETFLHVGGRRKSGNGVGLDFDELGVSEVVALLDAANMEAVLRDFGDRNPQEDPVIHFYELFLKEYDARKRMQRGVFYTPRPVVSFIVRSVHELLQIEFGLADGLADTATWGEIAERHPGLTLPDGVEPTDRFVTVLDPATGTGTFLVEAIEIIHRTLVDRWSREGNSAKRIVDLWNDYVPRHLLPRLHGYELLMAPYAIAHVKIGLKLHETGYRFGSEERARIFLTNALEPAHDFSDQFEFAIPALAHEAQAVNGIKRKQRFTVVIGNPPYSGHSANTSAWISDLVRGYHYVDGSPLGERNPKWLQDDYVKFLRFAERLLTDSSVGILGYITNHSYSDNPTFRGMRRSLMSTFPQLRVFDLHGNSKKKEKAPDGGVDENVFDIQQGVAILLAARLSTAEAVGAVYCASLWGTRDKKYAYLNAESVHTTQFSELSPTSPFYLYVPQDTDLRYEYERYVSVTELFPVNNMGVTTGDDNRFVAFAPSDFEPRIVRRSRIVDFSYRPFDTRKIYYAPDILARARFSFMRHMMGDDNVALVTIRRPRNDLTANFYVSHGLTDKCLISSLDNCHLFPLYAVPDESGLSVSKKWLPNIASPSLERLQRLLDLGNHESSGYRTESDRGTSWTMPMRCFIALNIARDMLRF
jgi:predicted helicase